MNTQTTAYKPFETAYYCKYGSHGVAASHTRYEVGTGYGQDSNGNKSCFACIGIRDKADLIALPMGGKAWHYLTNSGATWSVSNWPGTFKVWCSAKVGRHNWGLKRVDCWFHLTDEQGLKHCFWGVCINPDWNQTVRITKIKPF